MFVPGFNDECKIKNAGYCLSAQILADDSWIQSALWCAGGQGVANLQNLP